MKSFTPLVVCGHLLLVGAFQAHAQPVYRCGNSYSQIPCVGAVTVQTNDARSDQQRTEARQALASDKALAKELEARRLREEAKAAAEEKAQARSAAVQKKREVKSTDEATAWLRTDIPHKAKRKASTHSGSIGSASKSKKKSNNEPGQPERPPVR